MKIQSLQFKNDKDAFQVKVENGKSYFLSYPTYLAMKLHADSDLSPAEFSLLKEEDEKIRAKSWILSYCLSYRKSQKEVERKLREKGYSQEAREAALQYINQLGLVDDESYARDYAREKYERAHWSLRKIEGKLYEKGIRGEALKKSLAALDPSQEEENIRYLLGHQYQKRNLADPKERQRTTQALLRRGFAPSQVFSIMKEGDKEDELERED